MFREPERIDRDYADRSYTHHSPIKDLSPDRNILAFNPYVNNQAPIRHFNPDENRETDKQLIIQKRTSSPQPGQNYPSTIIRYAKQPDHQAVRKIQKPRVQNQNISLEEKQAIVVGLRQYFQKVLKTLSDQMNFELRKRDQDIKRLEKKLKDNETEIQSKEREIGKLKEHELQIINQNLTKINSYQKNDKISLKNKPTQELQRNFQYLTGRIRDIDSKIKQIIESHAFNAKQSKTLLKIEERVNGFMEDFLKIQTKKVYGLNLRMFDFFSSKDSLLVVLQRQIQAGKQTINSEVCPSKINMTVYQQKLNTMKRQLDGLHKTIQYIGQKQNKNQIEPGKIQKIQKQISRLYEKTNNVNDFLSSKSEIIQQYERQYKTIVSRINKIYNEAQSRKNNGQPDRRVVGHLKTTPKKETVPEIKPLKQKKISAPQVSSALYYSTHNEGSGVQQFNQSDDEHSSGKISEKLLHLMQIIRTGRKNMPLRCVVDKTGYLKEKETGSYLFDRNGVLFELEEDELEQAIKKGILKI